MKDKVRELAGYMLSSNPITPAIMAFEGLLSGRPNACLLIAVLGIYGSESLAEPGTIKLSTGLEYNSGDYGSAANTTDWFVPIRIKYERFPWSVMLSVPYIYRTAPSGVVGVGENRAVLFEDPSKDRTNISGFGDLVAGLSYQIEPFFSAMPYVKLTGKVKFPTADEDRGLGTGRFDYTILADLDYRFERFTPWAMIGYKIRGDKTVDLENVVLAEVGFDYALTDHYSGGLSLYYQERASDLVEDALQLSPYLNWRYDQKWSVSGYGIVGFSEGSPDKGVGTQITYQY